MATAANPQSLVVSHPWSGSQAHRAKPGDQRRVRSLAGVRWSARLGVLAILLIFAYQVHYVVLGPNFHVLHAGRTYRSATLEEKQLRQVVEVHGIRSVVNLRGPCPDQAWYQRQRNVLSELGVKQYDVNFSSCLVPGVDEMRKLVNAIDGAERPLLIHCRRGSDRTGLACTLLELLETDKSIAEASGQLSCRYGHLEFGKSGALHLVLRQYESWLARIGRSHEPQLLHDWLLNNYRPGPYWAEIEPLEVPTQLQLRSPELARFRVHNRSEFPWQFKQSSNSGFHLQYLLTEESKERAYVGGAGYFDHVLPPGESIELAFSLPAVSRPGRYHLRVDVGEEGRCWFFMLGSPCFETEITVGNPDAAPVKRDKKNKHGK